MKKTTTWQRLNSTQGILILLLLIAILPASWIGMNHGEIVQRNKELKDQLQRNKGLNRVKDRIAVDILEISAALQSLVAEPKNSAERGRARDADKDLAGAVDFLQTAHSDRPEISETAKKLRELQVHILDQADSDPVSAMVLYAKNLPSIRDRRKELLKELSDEALKEPVEMASNSLPVREPSAVAEGLATACLVAILLAGALIVWFQAAAVERPLLQLVETLERMRRGDFTKRLELDGQGQFLELGEGLNRLADDLSALVGQVQRSGVQVSANASRIATTAKEQQTTAHEIAATTAGIGATSREIFATSRELVKTIDEVSHVARDTAQLANSGQTAIGRMESTMRQIMDSSSSITAKLAVLNEKTGNINSVVTAITKVADQTNLLSLNAAIEAEKAGEYGLGFAVVAMEIRRLADQTAVATFDIEKTVKEMQSAVIAGVAGMDKFSEEVWQGVEEIRRVSTQLAQIIYQVQTLTPRFQSVNDGMHAQAEGARQISETLTQLSEAARQTAESLRQSSTVIIQLNEVARGLETSVAKFKVEP